MSSFTDRSRSKLLGKRPFGHGGTSTQHVGGASCQKSPSKEANDDRAIVPFGETRTGLHQKKVKEALQLLEDEFEKLLEEKKSRSKGNQVSARSVRKEAAMRLKVQKKWINTEKRLGPVPGVDVGDGFRFRVELVVIGLHHQFEGGIDYMKKDGRVLATSIVASGAYANVAVSAEVLMYSGHGGNPSVRCKNPEDQKLERGNLALMNSMDEGSPVRVIFGCKNLRKFKMILGRSRERKVAYVYNGLYKVTNCSQKRGPHGKLVYMFRLDRMPEQPTGILKTPKAHKVPVVILDISQGREKKPIPVVNAVDDEKPPSFNYLLQMIYPERYALNMLVGCDCVNGCSELVSCACTMKNGGTIPFNSNGTIIKPKPTVYECGPSCKCPPSCKNRVSQHGVKYQLEVFRTESRGWGVRSRDFISSGSFVCEYVGDFVISKPRTGNGSYSYFLLEALNGYRCTIDATQYGNVARFINHSSSPNLHSQKVFYDLGDKSVPHIMFFAAKSIPPSRELTHDPQVREGNGYPKK
ncbi:histone-lysine N-methyltransferase, H3 lysine-9 specific SUVH5-like [Diospyros lotus]|uniref:histone-lysine N-methyltransferase, H3 lysine-9 specific SUVH5-like n=1 Tax=Diospyros lotus TaxID=55363 RepID=UPI00225705E5|nr:histone-lysine N-methyltransferase, H3 lysine-9 specific SUVH5-like [Diospyros lotus]XP_052183453.1 histone-lysine N-methyltransferase, H3 lysine-9 specific SUVH5-like [Diospyros lotus]XP_052183462.1 histone-lysine N-methyltransferase, H3 lysine-9 specific SUVH5-like [Diospyros lotus]XP_052183470.1 histone-lysine N-methyltransferase, H3 lysine-9 specific SUVH5-like [Diospyros lotus]